MDLEQAKKVAELELAKADIVVVTSNHGIFLLEKEEEIKVVEQYATDNKLGCFVVKNESIKVEEKQEEDSDKPAEGKSKKKK